MRFYRDDLVMSDILTVGRINIYFEEGGEWYEAEFIYDSDGDVRIYVNHDVSEVHWR